MRRLIAVVGMLHHNTTGNVIIQSGSDWYFESLDDGSTMLSVTSGSLFYRLKCFPKRQMQNFASFGLVVSLVLLSTVLSVSAQEQQFAELGNFKLQSGEVIQDCRIGYRVFGKLNSGKSNAIVFPTWAGGTTEQLKSQIGPGKLIDSNEYFVIAVDALGNGVSSSPSNSKLQPRMSFPRFTLQTDK